MSIKNVKGCYFVTTELDRDTAREFCKEHKLFKDNGWNVGCLYGIEENLNSFSRYTGTFNIKDFKIITFEEFKNKFLGDNIEFNEENYEIY